MRWLTNLCASATFKPWTEVDSLPKTTSANIDRLLLDTRHFLQCYLHSPPPDPFSDSDSDTDPFPSTSPIDSLEILLATLQTTPPHHTRRNHPISSEFAHKPSQIGIRRPLTLVPTFAVYTPLPHSKQHQLPIVSVSQLSSTIPLLLPGATSSARSLAASFAEAFSDERHADPLRMEHAHIRTVMAAYEVAIAHALLSQSGCAAVTNGQNAVLLRVHACVHDAKRIVVSVSRAFGGRGMVHALAGLVGLGVQLGGELGREEDVRECAVRVGNVHTEFFFDRFAKERGGRRLRLGFQRGGGVTDGIIDKLLMEHCGVIGMGRSGVVLRSAFGKMNVAVKYWNEVDMDGLVELLDEIGVYRHLSEKFEEIVGVAVATPLVMRCEPKAEAMLVTEYVGSGLRRGKNGRLCMGDGDVWEEIADEDICEIRCAALNSLSLLHDCRVAHGDVALRNVRVRRTDDENKWMAWWIDLGHAEDECEDECSFEFDRFRFEQCFANSDALQEEEGGLFDL